MSTDDFSKRLEVRLNSHVVDDPTFWSFSELRSRSGNHALFQYPAMMVPELQGVLLDDLIAVDSEVSLVYDPFAGSGTIMLESLYRGLDFYGSDINPLAILLCQVKATPPSVEDLTAATSEVVARAASLTDVPLHSFPGVEKWFKPEVRLGLTQLRTSIQRTSDTVTRRFLWICLAETVRLVSNSRTSTFKLHVYPAEEIARRESNALKVFCSVAVQNAERLKLHWNRISKIASSQHVPSARLFPGSVMDSWEAPRRADVLMTSPPYGDNKTTVPYGQHSYLPLCWIDTDDIPGGFDRSLLESTLRIDSVSLGGSLRDADRARNELVSRSDALGRFLNLVDDAPSLRKKTLSFVRDYREALQSLRPRLRPGAFCFFTLGERRIGGQTFPLVEITKDLLVADGHEEVTTVERILPSSRKRMASKNRQGATMAQEWIVVTRSWENGPGGRK